MYDVGGRRLTLRQNPDRKFPTQTTSKWSQTLMSNPTPGY